MYQIYMFINFYLLVDLFFVDDFFLGAQPLKPQQLRSNPSSWRSKTALGTPRRGSTRWSAS